MDNNRTEKVTVNLGVMDMAQIDLLVDNMLYANRSDFIRTAIRNQLETHKNDLDKLYLQSQSVNFDPGKTVHGGIGIYKLYRKDLLDAQGKSGKVQIMVVGILLVDKNIEPELFENAVESIKVYGKIHAEKSILKLIKEKLV